MDPLAYIPHDAFDSHMHVVDPAIQALSAARMYTPPPAPLSAALHTLAPRLPQLCIVQPSIYGTDNTCTLAALAALGKARACAVIQLEPGAVTADQMRRWDDAGVRGVRINAVTRATAHSQSELESLVRRHAALIRPWGWVLQLYAPMSAMEFLGDMIPQLGVPVVLDHFAYPPSFDPLSSPPPGLPAVLRALSAPTSQFYIKISAPYRLDLPLASARALFDALHRAGPDRLVFATDWPHTMFDGYDTAAWIARAAEWAFEGGGEEAVRALFKTNAERLWRGREGR